MASKKETLMEHLSSVPGGIRGLARKTKLDYSTIYRFARGDGIRLPARTIHKLTKALNRQRSMYGQRLDKAFLMRAWKIESAR